MFLPSDAGNTKFWRYNCLDASEKLSEVDTPFSRGLAQAAKLPTTLRFMLRLLETIGNHQQQPNDYLDEHGNETGPMPTVAVTIRATRTPISRKIP